MPPLPDDLAAGSLLFLLASAFVAGLARGFSGFGAALIFVPLASAAAGPTVAAPLLLVVDGVLASTLLPNAWKVSDRRDVAVMSLGALAGVPLGTFVLASSDPLTIRWGIAALILALLALLLSGWRYRGRPAAPVTVGVGGLAGFLSGAAQVGGPPVVAYWLGGASSPPTVRANIVLFFAVSTVLTAIAYAAGGLLTATVFRLALLTGPAYAVGLLLGSRMFGLASEAAFRRASYALIAAAALLSLPAFDGMVR